MPRPTIERTGTRKTAKLTFETLILLPIGLGLLGFIEPCTIGAHMLFLRAIEGSETRARQRAVAIFALARTLTIGAVGAGFVIVGQRLVGVQTGLWLIFGTVYMVIGLAYLLDRKRYVTQRISLVPQRWKQARNPAVLGLAFGLNIPACAAPILFGLFGLAAGAGTLVTGFSMMALFGLALSLPLIVMVRTGGAGFGWLDRLRAHPRRMRLILGTVFALLGVWSIWFGLFVNPADWSGQ